MIGAVQMGGAALLPVMIVLAHRGLAPLLLVLGAVTALDRRIWREGVGAFVSAPDWRAPLTQAVWAFLAFCCWIALSSAWTMTGRPSLALNVLAPVFAAGAVVWSARASQKPLVTISAIAGLLSIALLFSEALTSGALRSITPPQSDRDMIALGRGASAAALLVFPTLALADRLWFFRLAEGPRAVVHLTICLALVAAAWRFEIAAGAAAVSAGLVVGVAALWAPRLLAHMVWASALALLALAPAFAVLPVEALSGLLGEAAPASWVQRLYIWRAGGEAALSCLPLGCGADAARALGESLPPLTLSGVSEPLSRMPTHPHQLFLQVWLETGLFGALSLAWGLYAGGRALFRLSLPRAGYAAISALAAAFLVSASLEMSLWQVWRLSAAGLGAWVIAIVVSAPSARRAPK